MGRWARSEPAALGLPGGCFGRWLQRWLRPARRDLGSLGGARVGRGRLAGQHPVAVVAHPLPVTGGGDQPGEDRVVEGALRVVAGVRPVRPAQAQQCGGRGGRPRARTGRAGPRLGVLAGGGGAGRRHGGWRWGDRGRARRRGRGRVPVAAARATPPVAASATAATAATGCRSRRGGAAGGRAMPPRPDRPARRGSRGWPRPRRPARRARGAARTAVSSRTTGRMPAEGSTIEPVEQSLDGLLVHPVRVHLVSLSAATRCGVTSGPVDRTSVDHPTGTRRGTRRTGRVARAGSAHGLRAVDRLAEDVGVPGVLGRLGDQVQQHPAHRPARPRLEPGRLRQRVGGVQVEGGDQLVGVGRDLLELGRAAPASVSPSAIRNWPAQSTSARAASPRRRRRRTASSAPRRRPRA